MTRQALSTRATPTIRWPKAIVWLTQDSMLLLLAMAYATFLALAAPFTIRQDSWLAFLTGRDIARHGLPSHDTLTVMAQGQHWVDQQWLAQLAFYGLFTVGGIALASFVAIVAGAGAWGASLMIARARGASERSVFAAGLAFAFLTRGMELRAQSLAYPLFVAVLALLVSDARRPGRRVLLVLPLLVLWGNLHGSAALGAGLVTLRGGWIAAGYVRRRVGSLPTALALLAAPLCLLATPYGLEMVSYYRVMLISPPFAGHVTEWMPPSFSSDPLFVVAGLASLWLVATSRTLTTFERVVMVILVASGFMAERNTTWLVFAGPMLLSAELDRLVAPRERDRASQRIGLVGTVVLIALFAHFAMRPESDFTSQQPAGAAIAVQRAVAADPHLNVFASDPQADWLLWTLPNLRGHLAYDVRFELLSAQEMARIWNFHTDQADWRRAIHGYRLFVLDRGEDGAAIDHLATIRGARTLFSDRQAVVLWLPSAISGAPPGPA